jgi:hypothetical protein
VKNYATKNNTATISSHLHVTKVAKNIDMCNFCRRALQSSSFRTEREDENLKDTYCEVCS